MTNQDDAVLLYQARITDTTKFSPLFTIALSWNLASMLAGAIIKGDTGGKESMRCTKLFADYLAKAQVSDAVQRRVSPPHVVPWTVDR